MEERPREMELNFDSGDNIEREAAESVPAENTAAEDIANENITDTDAESSSADVQSVSAAAVNTPGIDPLLRSRYPSNRPAGTPPLVSAAEQVTALETAIAGKSYGCALRILREQHGLTYQELEQVTMIQPRFQEALENERPDQPLVYVIAQIRSLCRFYKLSSVTSDALVAKLKEQLEYTCNDEFIGSLDVDSTGAEANDRKLKKILFSMIASVAAVVVLVVLLTVLISGGCGSSEDPAETPAAAVPEAVTAPGEEKFDSNTIYSLLEPPTMDLPKLPVAE